MEASDLCQDDRKGISIVNGVLLPCLDIIKQQSIPDEDNPNHSVNLIGQQIDYIAWQSGIENHQFTHWLGSLKANSDEERLKLKILKKYFSEWKSKTSSLKIDQAPPSAVSGHWLPQLLFCRWSQTARRHVCRVMAKLNQSRRNDIFRLMSSYLEHVDKAGESAGEFLELYAQLASQVRVFFGHFY